MNPTNQSLFHQIHTLIEQSTPKDDTLLGGKLGLVHYYFYLYQQFGNDEYAERALDLVEEAANLHDDESKTLFGAAFSSGGAGLGYTLKTLHNYGLLEMDLSEDLADLDDYLFNTALEMIEKDGNLDYLHGAAGIIHYFLFRLPDEALRERTETLVRAFINQKKFLPNGTWFSTYVISTDDRTEINCSLSHGQTAFLLILMNAWHKGFQFPEIKETIETGVQLIVSFKRNPAPDDELVAFFPSTIKSADTSQQLTSNRLAWCYGDLDILILLYQAGDFLNKPEWKQLASEMGANIVHRKTATETVVTDSHFCHGAAGLVQTYKYLHEISGEEMYRAASEYWLQQTVEMLPAELEQGLYKEKVGALLEGLVGVNLVLAESFSPVPLNWARMLLV